MEELLKNKTLQQVIKAESLGYRMSVEKNSNDLILVANPNTKKVAVMGTTEIDGQELMVAYLVNIQKWSWASDEGFTKDQIVDKFSSEIFTWTPIDMVANNLL